MSVKDWAANPDLAREDFKKSYDIVVKEIKQFDDTPVTHKRLQRVVWNLLKMMLATRVVTKEREAIAEKRHKNLEAFVFRDFVGGLEEGTVHRKGAIGVDADGEIWQALVDDAVAEQPMGEPRWQKLGQLDLKEKANG